MMEQNPHRFTFAKLSGQRGWARWKTQVLLQLEILEVQDIVLSTRVRPVKPELEGADVAPFQAQLKAFEKGDAIARQLLYSVLDDPNFVLVGTSGSAHEAWGKLLAVYEQRSGQRLDRLMEEFFRVSMDPTDSIVVHGGKLQQLFTDLNGEFQTLTKQSLPNLLLCGRLIFSLSPDFFEIRTHWDGMPIEEKTFQHLMERLRLIEQRLPSKQGGESAFVAGNSVGGGGGGNRKPKQADGQRGAYGGKSGSGKSIEGY